MIFARENYSKTLIEEMRPLWQNHYRETATPNYGGLDPDLGLYENAASLGLLRVFTARQNGCLVGYQVYFVAKHPHHQESIQAVQDILFLVPQERKGLTALKFIKWCVDRLTEEGISIIHQRISAVRNVGRIFERLGFQLEDLTYSRRI